LEVGGWRLEAGWCQAGSIATRAGDAKSSRQKIAEPGKLRSRGGTRPKN
jgi:hypothetical protein